MGEDRPSTWQAYVRGPKTGRSVGRRRRFRPEDCDCPLVPRTIPGIARVKAATKRGNPKKACDRGEEPPASCSSVADTSFWNAIDVRRRRGRYRRARRRRNLVFVEVKTLSSLKHGLPSEAVTPKKRARYERIAGYFPDYDGMECRVRFDVISILALPNGRALVRHYINAFGAGC
ncbi:MAG: YraN family protein [Slackia sp.]